MTMLKKTAKNSPQAILVGIFLPHEKKTLWGNSPLDELRSLAQTAGVDSMEEFIQYISFVNTTYYLGRGKAEALAQLAKDLEVDLIFFDNELSPSQQRNLEKLTKCKVMDRSELILDIFVRHARTKQAKLQVQLAQMEYVLPRLKRMWSHLSRIDGQLGAKGPGEQQIEMDRRMIRKKIVRLRRNLKTIQQRKEREVNTRKDIFSASLVGYTNAGKSTLMNSLTGSDVFVEDKLFATLDTRTRMWKLSPSRKILLSDTVGFISKIPAHLIASFHATLEEVTQADLLLHVVDLSQSAPMEQIGEVQRVLKTLGCHNKPNFFVFNKVDLMSDPIELNLLRKAYPDHVVVSAKKKIDLEQLQQRVLELVSIEDEEIELTTPVSNGKLLSFLFKNTTILNREYNEKEAHFLFKMDRRLKGQLKDLMGK